MIINSGKYLKTDGEMSSFKQMTTALLSPHMNIKDAKWFMFASSTKNIISTQSELMDYMYFGIWNKSWKIKNTDGMDDILCGNICNGIFFCY